MSATPEPIESVARRALELAKKPVKTGPEEYERAKFAETALPVLAAAVLRVTELTDRDKCELPEPLNQVWNNAMSHVRAALSASPGNTSDG